MADSGELHRIVERSSTGTEDADILKAEGLLANGHVWNELDAEGQTPGCNARRKGLARLYQAFVRAGVRTEVLLNALQEDGEEKKEDDETARYLSSDLEFSASAIRDDEKNAVMMDWETGIMRRSAEILLPTPGLRVLNIGFGMGILDGFLQERRPRAHTIVEAHPKVLQRMKETGWFEKPGVHIIQGRWQDVRAEIEKDGAEYDGIFYDPFGEYYHDMRRFFDVVTATLAVGSTFSFFHGLGADRQISYDIYTQVVEIDLQDFALGISWEHIDVEPIDWHGTKRAYWNVEQYRLPVCRYLT